MDQYIGKLLDNRYEILELVGVGGMARVYKARCHRLNRLVAIKILREDLAQDAELRRRFHDESQAVAMLSHPNIVAVYDVSRSSELEYIVMELIDGITLKQYMQKKGNKLNWREALHFITQITKALGHAHSRGIIHRDIKPHNVMVLRDGSIKVADFGIARLASGGHSTLTQEALGSVHYISPEQARGSHIDARSDLYSTGVVLYEMITGRLPFEGDTPVSVAIQHINSIPLSPREIDPSIPEALEAITMKAMAPNPDNRYSSADEMLADLEEFRKNPNINFDYNVTEFLLEEEPDDAKTQIHSVPSHHTRTRIHDTHNHSRREEGSHSRPRRYEEPDDYDNDYRPSEKPRSAFPWPIVAAVAAVLVFLGIVFFFLYETVLSDFFDGPPDAPLIPKLVGELYDEVKDDEELLGGLTLVIGEEIPDESAKAGTILKQSPEGDSERKEGDTKITVTISTGPEQIMMTDVLNMEYKEAYLILTEQGLKVTTDYEHHETVPKGHVISYTPFHDVPLKPGDEVHLVLSMGPKVEPVVVPDLKGSTLEKALSDIKLMKLGEGEVLKEFSDTVPEGCVIKQYPEAGAKVDEGTQINLRISEGPDPSTVTPEQSSKSIDITLPTSGDMVSVVVMLDGVVILSAEYDTAMDTRVPVLITGPAGSVKTVTWYFDGVLSGNQKVELKP